MIGLVLSGFRALDRLDWGRKAAPRSANSRPLVRFSTLTLDHVIPLSKGGTNDDADNFVLACGPCNSSKWNRDLDGWMATR